MKPSVAIALIVMGGLIVLAPPTSDYLYQQQVARMMTGSGSSSIVLQGLMPDIYRFGCWLTGFSMVIMAVVGSRPLKTD